MTSIEGISSDVRDAEITTCPSEEGRWNGRDIALVAKSGARIDRLISHLRPSEDRLQQYTHLMRANALMGNDRSSPSERNNRSSPSPLDLQKARDLLKKKQQEEEGRSPRPGKVNLPPRPEPPAPLPSQIKPPQPVNLTPPPKPSASTQNQSPPPKPVSTADSLKPAPSLTSSSPKPPSSPASVAASSTPAQRTPPPAAKLLPSSQPPSPPSKLSTEKPSASAPFTTKPAHPFSSPSSPTSAGNHLAPPPPKPVTLPPSPPHLPPGHEDLFGPSSVKEPLSSSSSSGRKGEDPFAPFLFSAPLVAAPGHIPIEPAILPRTTTTKVEPSKPALPPAPSFPLPDAPTRKMEFISTEKLLSSNLLPKTSQGDISPIIDINSRGNLAAGASATYVSEDATLKVNAETTIDHKKNIDTNVSVSKETEGGKKLILKAEKDPDGVKIISGVEIPF